jgi:hypothetical protein
VKAQKEMKEAATALAAKENKCQQSLQPRFEYRKSHQFIYRSLQLGRTMRECVVQCEATEDYCDHLGEIALDNVQPSIHGTTAEFTFAVVEGTMLLYVSDNVLQLRRRDLESDSDGESNEGLEDVDFWWAYRPSEA